MTDPRPTSESQLVDFIRSIDVRAPESLHRQVQSMIAAGSSRGARAVRGPRASREGAGARRFSADRSRIGQRLAAVGAIAAAVIALALAVSLSGGGSSTLSVHDASALTRSPATAGPPAESRSDRRELTAAVDGVSFPYWGERFGWRSTGSRSDRIDGRAVRTIFYADARGRRIGYAIVAGSAPPQPTGGVVAWRDGTPYRLFTQNGAPVVSWVRHGHLCVVSGHGVDGATLLRLASWDDRPVAS